MQSLRDILPSLLPAAAAPAVAWQIAAGPELAARAACRGLRAGTLLLQAEDTAARTQIESIAPELLTALQRTLPQAHIRRLHVSLP